MSCTREYNILYFFKTRNIIIISSAALESGTTSIFLPHNLVIGSSPTHSSRPSSFKRLSIRKLIKRRKASNISCCNWHPMQHCSHLMQNDEVMYKHHLVIKHIDSYTEKNIVNLLPCLYLCHNHVISMELLNSGMPFEEPSKRIWRNKVRTVRWMR